MMRSNSAASVLSMIAARCCGGIVDKPVEAAPFRDGFVDETRRNDRILKVARQWRWLGRHSFRFQRPISERRRVSCRE